MADFIYVKRQKQIYYCFLNELIILRLEKMNFILNTIQLEEHKEWVSKLMRDRSQA